MNIIEAIKSGKRFRLTGKFQDRPHSTPIVSTSEWIDPKTDIIIFRKPNGDSWICPLTDFNHEIEIEEEKIEITKSQFEEAFEKTIRGPGVGFFGVRGTGFFSYWKPIILRELGFKE